MLRRVRAAVGDDVTEVRRDAQRRACAQLARREYSHAELQRWLCQRGYELEIATKVADELVEAGLISDRRFAESFARVRRDAGYGPRRIEIDLREKGVSREIISDTLAMFEDEWRDVAARVYRKRLSAFGQKAEQHTARKRAVAFLIARGFEHAHWQAAMNDEGEND